MAHRLAMHETSITIPGSSGHIEAALGEPVENKSEEPIFVVICHPDPLQCGTMDNKVVTTAGRGLRHIGAYTVRFNYRGVGESDGRYGDGLGEADDAKAVIQWIRLHYPKARIALAGFSFGAYIVLRIAPDITPTPLFLVTIAPVVTHKAFDTLKEVTCPWWLLLGDQDELISTDAVLKWTKTRIHSPELIVFQQCTHFFHGQLTALREMLEDRLKPLVAL